MAEVRYECRSTVTTLPDGRKYLLVTLTLICPVCGMIEMQLPGHHLRRVVELLREQLLLHDELTSHARADEDLAELIEMGQAFVDVKKETLN